MEGETLDRRAQLRALTALARAALAEYGFPDAPLALVGHLYNTVFRVETPSGRCVLRIHRLGETSPEKVRSEMAWLSALQRDTQLGVPEPLATPMVEPVVVA